MGEIQRYDQNQKNISEQDFNKKDSNKESLSELDTINIEINALRDAFDNFGATEEREDKIQKEIIGQQLKKLETKRNILNIQTELDNLNEEEDPTDRELGLIKEFEMRIQALEDREYDIKEKIKELETRGEEVKLKSSPDTIRMSGANTTDNINKTEELNLSEVEFVKDGEVDEDDKDDNVMELQEEDLIFENDEDNNLHEQETIIIKSDNGDRVIRKVFSENTEKNSIQEDIRRYDSDIEPSPFIEEIKESNELEGEVDEDEVLQVAENEDQLEKQAKGAKALILRKLKGFLGQFKVVFARKSQRRFSEQERLIVAEALNLGHESLIKIDINTERKRPIKRRSLMEILGDAGAKEEEIVWQILDSFK